MNPNELPGKLSMYLFGVGGAGCNMLQTVRRMNLPATFLVALNCDKESLNCAQADLKFQIGTNLTRGLGTGANPDIGARAFMESKGLVNTFMDDSVLYCIMAGFGGGTGGGAGPELAAELSRRGLPTTAIVTLPFHFEGKKRMANAEVSLKKLKRSVKSPIVIPNQSILAVVGKSITLMEAFEKSALACEYVVEEILSTLCSDSFRAIEIPEKFQILDIIRDTLPNALHDIERQLSFRDTLLHHKPNSRIFMPDDNRNLLKAISFDPSVLKVISPRKFEELLCCIYELAGYKVKLTSETRDRGADLIVFSPSPLFGREFLTVVQAKKFDGRRKVGDREIRELAGAQFIFNAHRAQCITTFGYTEPARKTAKKLHIDLGLFYELLRLMDQEFRKQ